MYYKITKKDNRYVLYGKSTPDSYKNSEYFAEGSSDKLNEMLIYLCNKLTIENPHILSTDIKLEIDYCSKFMKIYPHDILNQLGDKVEFEDEEDEEDDENEDYCLHSENMEQTCEDLAKDELISEIRNNNTKLTEALIRTNDFLIELLKTKQS